MLAVRLIGGLGNQMFQYAYGRCLAAKQNQELVLDLSTLSARTFGTPRDYSLGIFNITAELASFLEIMKRCSFALHAVELECGFHQELLHLPPFPGLYLDGFWQSERYFESVSDLIRAEFRFKQGFHSYAELLHDIQPQIPVSLHVRRTDYLNRGTLTPFVGLEYYRSAIELIAGRVSMPHFLIFSDDLDWCRKSGFEAAAYLHMSFRAA
jgi:glycosyl transferase family 11